MSTHECGKPRGGAPQPTSDQVDTLPLPQPPATPRARRGRGGGPLESALTR